ncbi:tetratricopeptide repeat protein [Kitasatospora cathayae]|uniref:Tetratricopeptide repeat protein n=1 Tax=Kitasatospora cathayae TaxID=3004092 RepID=A0ABY7QFH1_9ACTN|nr:tetratricopeptide repeat protein [Kitasatospora sp. HUAS 3-15]WBP91372.1 tetratricopeptide repeat protein [Kitasatospora sp. HUAS 3-15]
MTEEAVPGDWPGPDPDDGDDVEIRIANLQGHLHAVPYDTAVRRELGFELAGAQRWEEAVGVLSSAVELAPWDVEVVLELGRAFAALERWGDAEERFTAAVALRPGCAAAHGELGYVLLHQQRLEDAGVSFRAALACDPASALGHLGLAEVLQAGDTRADEVAVHARAAVAGRREPRVLGQALLDGGDYDGAYRAASWAHELAPDWGRTGEVLSSPWESCSGGGKPCGRPRGPSRCGRRRGRSTRWAGLVGRGRLYAAEQVLRRGVAMDPAVCICRWNLACLLVRVGRTREADPHLAVLLRDDFDDGQAHGLLGWIHLISGRREQAREELGRAVRLLGATRTAAWPLLLLGALERAGDPPLARRYFAAAAAMTDRLPSAGVYSHPCATCETRALAFAALGDVDRARRCLQEALAVRDGADRFDPRLYGLFTRPPLAGLDVLIGLWEGL